MSITLNDVRKIAQLAQLELDPTEETQTLTHLDNIFQLIDQMSDIDTRGIAPLNHPISIIQEMQQRLRADIVTEVNQRDANMLNAPQKDMGLFLVPKVIE